jgi:uncharacterized protein
MTETTAAPVTAAERIDLLDGLRGFALLGILMANILYWSGWLFLPPDRAIAIAGPTQFAVDAFLPKLVVDGKFYTIFSLLFGLGFALQLSRLERRGANGIRIFYRRLLVLLAIGLVHLCLIWDGDILTLYALLGMFLPLFRKWSERGILIAGLVFLLLPLAGVPLFHALGWAPWMPFTKWEGGSRDRRGCCKAENRHGLPAPTGIRASSGPRAAPSSASACCSNGGACPRCSGSC